MNTRPWMLGTTMTAFLLLMASGNATAHFPVTIITAVGTADLEEGALSFHASGGSSA